MLKNKLVVVTRDTAGNKQLAALLKKIGARVYKLPTIKIAGTEPDRSAIAALKNISAYDFIIFSSVHAVEFFIRATKNLKIPINKINRLIIVVIGPATYQAAKKAKLNIGLPPESFTTSGIVKGLGKIAGKKILLPRSKIAPRDLVKKLRQKKATVTEAVLYTTLPIKKPAMKFKISKVNYITFASPSAVLAFPGRLKNVILFKQALLIPAVCIGSSTAKAAKKFGFKKLIIAKTHTTEGMVSTLQKIT